MLDLLCVPMTDQAVDHLDQLCCLSLADETVIVDAFRQEANVINLNIMGTSAEVILAAVGPCADDELLFLFFCQGFFCILYGEALFLMVQHVKDFVFIVNVAVNVVAICLDAAIILEMEKSVRHFVGISFIRVFQKML